MNIEQIQRQMLEFGHAAVGYLSQGAIVIQMGMILVMGLMALLLARRLKPRIQDRARQIKGRLGLLRVIVAFLHRLEWFIFFVLLVSTRLITEAVAWPSSNYLIYVSMLLSGAWFLIYLASHVARSRLVGKVLAIVGWLYVGALILGIADEIGLILDNAGFTIGTFRISALRILQAAVFLSLLLWLAWRTGNFLDARLQNMEELTPSLRVLLGKVLRIAVLVFAVLIAMQGLGIDLTAFTVLSGAIGVGIGFGLQKVVSNFISGIIILLDQSIKPGDTITLGTTFGWIRELRARFVSVVTRDGREYLIPNEDFITHEVINWSFTDKFVRLDVPFGVAYDSDPHEVTRLAISATADVDRVDSTYNRPVCWMTEFGDSSLNFLLRFWISDPQNGLTNIRGKVLLALWDTFKDHGIKIPFPHREVIMKTPVEVSDRRSIGSPDG